MTAAVDVDTRDARDPRSRSTDVAAREIVTKHSNATVVAITTLRRIVLNLPRLRHCPTRYHIRKRVNTWRRCQRMTAARDDMSASPDTRNTAPCGATHFSSGAALTPCGGSDCIFRRSRTRRRRAFVDILTVQQRVQLEYPRQKSIKSSDEQLTTQRGARFYQIGGKRCAGS